MLIKLAARTALVAGRRLGKLLEQLAFRVAAWAWRRRMIQAKLWRMLTAFYVALAILALGVLIIVHEWGHYIVAKWCNMRVDRFAIGFGPALWSTVRGDTTFQVGAIPLGGYVQIAGLNPDDEAIAADDPRSYPNRPAWQRFLTIAAGPIVNYVFAVIVFFFINFFAGVPGTMVKMLIPGQPAEAAGLLSGDVITRINGQPVGMIDEVRPLIAGSGGKPLEMQVRRGAELKTVVVTPVANQGSYSIGIQMSVSPDRERLGLAAAAKVAAIEPWRLTVNQVSALAAMITGKHKAKMDDFVSIIGITQMIAQQMGQRFVEGLELAAKISALLGFFNLLPLPALDGGRLVFLSIEVITRRRVNHRIEQIVHMVGMVILLGLMLLLVAKDLRRLFGI
jgi:regulator of sigma E protease